MSKSKGDNIFVVAKYRPEINQILNIDLPCSDVYQSHGLEIHMRKRKHFECIPYLKNISEIIENPDYVGLNPSEKNSVELVKAYDINILVAVKLDIKNDYLYVASMYSLSKSKLERRIKGKRLKKFK